jgi:hypothetical protein
MPGVPSPFFAERHTWFDLCTRQLLPGEAGGDIVQKHRALRFAFTLAVVASGTQ